MDRLAVAIDLATWEGEGCVLAGGGSNSAGNRPDSWDCAMTFNALGGSFKPNSFVALLRPPAWGQELGIAPWEDDAVNWLGTAPSAAEGISWDAGKEGYSIWN